MSVKRILFKVTSDDEYCGLVVEGADGQSETVERKEFPRNNREISGNIYRGKVVKMSQNTDAVQVDIGHKGNAFLSTSKEPDKALKAGDSVLVVVHRDAQKNKQPILKTTLELRGQFFVLKRKTSALTGSYVPPSAGRGDTKHEKKYKRLYNFMKQCPLPEDYSLSALPLAIHHKEDRLKQDIDELLGTLENIQKQPISPPRLLHEITAEQNLKEWLSSYVMDCEEVVVDNKDFCERTLRPLLLNLYPQMQDKIRIETPLVEGELFSKTNSNKRSPRRGDVFSNRVPIAGGGSLTYNQTEALLAINVHADETTSGTQSDFGATNVDAVDAVSELLKTHKLGGIVVIVFLPATSGHKRTQVTNKMKRVFNLFESAKEESIYVSRGSGNVIRTPNVIDTKFDTYIMTYTQRNRPAAQALGKKCKCCKNTGFEKFPLRKIKVRLDPGSLVVNQVERLIAIDVNSSGGKRGSKKTDDPSAENHRNNHLAINLCATKSIENLLKERDVLGLVVVDFISMESAAHRTQVEQAMSKILDLTLGSDGYWTGPGDVRTWGRIEPVTGTYMFDAGGYADRLEPCEHCGGVGWIES